MKRLLILVLLLAGCTTPPPPMHYVKSDAASHLSPVATDTWRVK